MEKGDKELLNLLQSGLPIVSRPFKCIAEALGQEESWVLERIKSLQREGVIRRLGGIFDSRRLGFSSTLIAMKVPDEGLEQVIEVINSYPGVTHNYIRNHEYNLWFTLTVPSAEEMESTLKEILEKTGIVDYLNLSTRRVFKINVEFTL